jgi:predicted ArsR family transcriptional regulator
MTMRVDAATLDRQPKQRRTVYESLAQDAEGRSVAQLLQDWSAPEAELRETLRKLEAAGLVERKRAVWTAVPIEARSTGA